MADRGIIFSGPMVNALLAGTKTQTRRLLKPRHANSLVDGTWSDSYILDPGNAEWLARDIPHAKGDRLYVRETWSHTGQGVWDIETARREGPAGAFYLADGRRAGCSYFPSIHMPREFSRLWLEVIEVRAERLQAISDVDALAEGCRSGFIGEGVDRQAVGPAVMYAALWDSLHANEGERWADNPWVYAVTFEVHQGNIDAPEPDIEPDIEAPE